MKNTHVCPKCTSSNIVKIPNSSGYNMISINLSLLKVAHVCRYICCDCGYTEEWVENDLDLPLIMKKFQ